MTQYGPTEERWNIITHATGLLLSLAALPLMLLKTSGGGNMIHIFSAAIYGISLITLYSASTFYHATGDEDLRDTMETVDHSSIFVLIAGSYTPFALVVLDGFSSWLLFGLAWGLAVAGIVFKFVSDGKYKTVSLISYILMGGISVFFIEPIAADLKFGALAWLTAGGMFYLTGAALYGLKPFKYNHSVFHALILLGSVSHFVAIYYYVLPGSN